jgi:hypothetical protein
MQSTATTVDEYLAELSAERRALVQTLRQTVLDNLDPDIEEGMPYGMIGHCVPHRVYPPGYQRNRRGGTTGGGRRWCARLPRLVAHVVGQRAETLPEMHSERLRHAVLRQRGVHAPEPLVPFACTNGKRHMPHAQSRVTVLLRVQRWATSPPAQKLTELLARHLQTGRMQRANGRRFRCAVHKVVEPVDEPANAVLATEQVEVGGRGRGHLQ